MNIRPDIAASPTLPAGVSRRIWTVADLRRLEEAGILRRDERVELIAGEVISMAPKGARHEVLRNELILNWARRLPLEIKFAEEPPLTLDDHYEPEPDIILFPAALKLHQVRGDNVLLVVEIADSSLKWDMETKSKVYASYGVVEYWAVNALTLETTAHLEPGKDGYGAVRTNAATDVVVPSRVPQLAVRMADLPLDDV